MLWWMVAVAFGQEEEAAPPAPATEASTPERKETAPEATASEAAAEVEAAPAPPPDRTPEPAADPEPAAAPQPAAAPAPPPPPAVLVGDPPPPVPAPAEPVPAGPVPIIDPLPPAPASPITAAAELRFDLDLPQSGSNMAFAASRARIGADLAFNDSLGGRLVVDAAGGLQLVDAYLQGQTAYGDVAHRMRAGVQLSSFGVDGYASPDGFFFAHPAAFQRMAERVGVVDRRDAGLSYQLRAFELVTADVQIVNGTGANVPDDNYAKDYQGRLQIQPIEQLTVVASALYGAAGPDLELVYTAMQVGGVVRLGELRAMAEYVTRAGQTVDEETQAAGWAAAAAYDLALGVDWIDHLGVAVSHQQWDGDTLGSFPDMEWVTDAGLTAWWTAPNEASAWTGLTYENLIPENIEEPVSHQLLMQWGFAI